MKILAFAASNSRQSINKQLVGYAAHLIEDGLFPDAEVEILDLNDFEMPIYSIDREQNDGIHPLAQSFKAKVQGADGIIISFAEHNGSYSAAYKNIFDWASRMEGKVYEGKKVALLATSPGPSGARSVLGSAEGSMPFFGATVVGTLSVPGFFDNFDADAQRLSSEEHDAKLKEVLSGFAD